MPAGGVRPLPASVIAPAVSDGSGRLSHAARSACISSRRIAAARSSMSMTRGLSFGVVSLIQRAKLPASRFSKFRSGEGRGAIGAAGRTARCSNAEICATIV
jgi:hypothetical protein